MFETDRNFAFPVGVDRTQPHRYGALRVPATAGVKRYMSFFFDGAHIPGWDISWNQYNPATPPPPVSPSSRIRRPKAVFLATGARYQFDIPRRYLAATAENRCSEDLPYSHALIRVPTIVLREFELAQRHENQPESSSARCPRSLCSADLFG